jgi:hypothetical protein
MSIMQPQTQEAQRIIEEYSRREREIPADFYALWRPANLYIWQGHERAVLRGLSRAGLLPLMWSIGTGADMMKRVAAPMIGGIFTSFILELIVYPAIFALWDEAALRWAQER